MLVDNARRLRLRYSHAKLGDLGNRKLVSVDNRFLVNPSSGTVLLRAAFRLSLGCRGLAVLVTSPKLLRFLHGFAWYLVS